MMCMRVTAARLEHHAPIGRFWVMERLPDHSTDSSHSKAAAASPKGTVGKGGYNGGKESKG